MAFSYSGILAVLLEFIRAWVPFIIAVAFISVVLLVLALRRHGLGPTLQALRPALLVGLFMGFLAFALGPWITGATHANLSGAIDWLTLLFGSLMVGLTGMLAIWPPFAVWGKGQ